LTLFYNIVSVISELIFLIIIVNRYNHFSLDLFPL